MASKKQLKIYAKKLKENPTKSEIVAKKLIKKANIPFMEQIPFKYYILDFIITNRLLIVEIDGGYHKNRREKDKQRDIFCNKMGLKVLRIKNENVNSIIRKIKNYPKVKNYKYKLRNILNKIDRI